MNFRQALEFLETLPDMERARHGSGITMSVESMKRLLGLLQHPQTKTKTIHITGSKGKGSTATFIASMLQAAGFHTAVFTSPHLHSYRERIAFDLHPVSEQEFAQGVDEIAKTLQKADMEVIGPISTFGVLTALFFQLVAKREPPVDWQIVEVGLGGISDATNVFVKKEVAVLTPISLEHTAILGSDLGAIATQKSGIITHGTNVVLAPQRDAIVRDVVAGECRKMSAKLIDVAQRVRWQRGSFDAREQRFSVSNGDGVSEYSLGLAGQHQIVNACTALTVIDVLTELGSVIDESAKSSGLKQARLPGRFEIFSGSQVAGKKIIFVLDGAHNSDSARALRQSLLDYFPGAALKFVLALNSDKKVEEFWQELSRVSHKAVVTKTDNPRAFEPEVLKERILGCDPLAEVNCAQTVAEALRLVSVAAEQDEIICVTGSLYLVAEARELLAERKTVTFGLL